MFPRCIQLSLLHDKELNQLTKGSIVPQGGVLPYIHPVLLGRQAATESDQATVEAGDDQVVGRTSCSVRSFNFVLGNQKATLLG